MISYNIACKTKEGDLCLYPFKWWWSTYDSCVTCSNVQCNAPDTWCATELNSDLTYKKWGRCDSSCDVAGTCSNFFICSLSMNIIGSSQITVYFISFNIVVHGGWSEWSSYTDCSKTCDEGTKSRSRTCTRPVPSSGGSECDGNASETMNCELKKCVTGTYISIAAKNKDVKSIA